MSESQSQNYSITTPIANTRTLCSSRQPIDYLSLNNGLEEDIPLSPKRRKKTTHCPRSAPSATHVAVHKSYSSPEAEEIGNKQSLSGISSTPTGPSPLSSIPTLSGIPSVTLPEPTNSEKLPDLVVNHDTDNIEAEFGSENASANPASTEEELEAADILLSLGEVRDDMLDDDENAQLMPIGLPTNVIDAAPVPLRLDQENVNSAIANIIQADELNNSDEGKTDNAPDTVENVDVPDTTSGKGDTTTLDATADRADDRPKSASPMQGSFKIKTHVLKKKIESKCKYKCMVCGVVKSSMQLINDHHIKSHKPQICAICVCSFALASSLTRHMYDHNECRY